MAKPPTYEELEQRVEVLEKLAFECKKGKELEPKIMCRHSGESRKP